MPSTESPLVSVIIPAYNSGQWIVDCVTSVLRQTYGNLQIIVVDDGSTDNTCELLRPLLPPSATLVQQANRGVAAARNAGLSLATGEFVAFLDHDDAWEEDKIQLQVGYLNSHPDVVVVYTDAVEYTDNFGECRSFASLHPDIAHVELLIEAIIRCHVPLLSTVMLRREFLVRHKIAFDAEASGVDDVGLFLEILGRGGRFAYLESRSTRRRMHGQNQSRDHLRRFSRRIALYRNLLSRCGDMAPAWKRRVRVGLSDAYFRVGECAWAEERRHEARMRFQEAVSAWRGNWKAQLGILYTLLPPALARALRKAKNAVRSVNRCETRAD
jgi:glycosyltransferase involved in cell wall biosynthesis